MQILQQHRNIALSLNTQAAQGHTNPLPSQNSPLDTPLHSREKKSSSTPRTLTQASLIRKRWQATRPTPPTARNLHNKEEPPTAIIQKGHSKHSNINKMKRQRNTKQVKEQDKWPPNQTKEEERGNLPDKEFQIMIGKMIQHLKNKLEL